MLDKKSKRKFLVCGTTNCQYYRRFYEAPETSIELRMVN